MVRDPSREPEPPSVDEVLDALADDAARRIVAALTEPKTASELSEECDIPLSTTYRKLEKLTDASLLSESTDIRRDGQHTTRYSVSFDAVTVSVDGDGDADRREFDVEFSRPERTRDERLADLWSELREET
ncbi:MULTISPECIES: helix-turn-helix domain-containing protein [Halorubrum]|jgi:DNA-binding transcriptional ArsR family regulator|uniref:IclR family transcriptional regulator n=1 Tax=Halorubrum tropicale TaxID=1765655 RepID=A0A0N1IV21_9EURY|nr:MULTISPECIES: helix-turn-helix domain-containing protein [Halorubrum]KOX98133.1 IclR family transcriptional regulator [Halorubrum tropicale]RLM50668.1 ArsR family transcriptional regulator [Halorubrum sp. Atlit-28R]TKX42636.1 ArsR family transcriptional regulator [Halorubrum sp. ARQ200]TKX51333.1 ArsR family transcriptional regulator [Halorubrum sp. ASP121]TKX58737.1 ArsR family transcriptional regulator [Halorubrum sp. ASP1]